MLAAARHDEGKRDPRFQLMLHAGDRWQQAAATAPLAKPGMDPAGRFQSTAASARSADSPRIEM